MPNLFAVFPQHREELAIWKLMHTPDFWEYANNYPVKWVGINIPMNLFGNNGFEGDIDMLFSLSAPPVPGYHPDYLRTYEVKTATIDGEGNIKSFDNEKFEHGFEQCQKLERFGSEMVFLIEYIILESGKTPMNEDTWKKVTHKLGQRKAVFDISKYGYNVKFRQYLPDTDEYSAGTYVPSADLSTAEFLPKGEPLATLAAKLDEIAKHAPLQGIRILFVCKNCKKVAFGGSELRNQMCNHCGTKVVIHD